MSLPTPLSIQTHIAAELACEHIEVDGDGQHFNAIIVSTAFAQLSRIARHQLVYAALGDRMKSEIHALSIKAFTPAEWQTAS